MALPFEPADNAHSHEDAAARCPLHGLLPEALRERADTSTHLMDYLHMMPIAEVGVPDFYPELTRNLGDIAQPNLIYPVSDEIFVHIYPDAQDIRDYYIPVEPSMATNLQPLLTKLEKRLLEYVDALSLVETEEGKIKVLTTAVEENCIVTKSGNGHKNGGKPKRKLFGLLPPGSAGEEALIPVTPRQLAALKYLLVRDKIGLGLLEPFIRDTYIEDISCSGLGCLFVEHKIFKGLKSSVSFDDTEELDQFVLRLSEKVQKPATFRNPIVDAALPDGSRINIVYGGDVSKRGSNFTIRKFTDVPMSVLDLVGFGSMDYKIAAYMSLIISEGCNVFISGETASGKTTLMNALTTFIPTYAKIVSIEDTPELQVPHPNWIREVVRGAMSDLGGSGVDMFALLKAALRQRPNEIIIGEIRGEEGAIAFQAMQTGHACMATFHAATVEKLIQRMTGHPIDVPKTYIDNLNIIVFCSAVRLPSGKMGRRVTSVNELVGYDPSTDSFSFIEVFRWDSHKDKHAFTGDRNSYLLENKIAPRRGLSSAEKRVIYQEVDRRAALLQKLHESGTTNFYDLYKVLARAQREGLF